MVSADIAARIRCSSSISREAELDEYPSRTPAGAVLGGAEPAEPPATAVAAQASAQQPTRRKLIMAPPFERPPLSRIADHASICTPLTPLVHPGDPGRSRPEPGRAFSRGCSRRVRGLPTTDGCPDGFPCRFAHPRAHAASRPL